MSHETALSVHEVGDANPAVVHLTVPFNFRARARGVRLHHGVLPEYDVLEHAGFRVTTVLRTVLDVAAGNLDLNLLATAIDDAVEHGMITTQALRGRADEFGPHAALRIERALRTRDPA
ncbi:MAG: hypothetical protein ACRDYX_17780 [Egibacteraceae bacterium]